MNDNGVFITQAGSPYYATKAFYCVVKTLKSAEFRTLPIQNQLLTLGQWGWVIAKKSAIDKSSVNKIKLNNISLKWLNQDAIPMLTSFGKPLVDTTGIKINTIFNPKLYIYYQEGNWDLY